MEWDIHTQKGKEKISTRKQTSYWLFLNSTSSFFFSPQLNSHAMQYNALYAKMLSIIANIVASETSFRRCQFLNRIHNSVNDIKGDQALAGRVEVTLKCSSQQLFFPPSLSA